MNVTLELAQILDAIDRNGSFEAAAQELHKVRSALTYNIRKFEDRVGVKVFDRSEHRAKFTAAGRLLLEQGRQLLHFSKQIEENVKQSAAGWETVLRIAHDEMIYLPSLLDLIKKFQQQCPRINLEIYTETIGGCSDALASDRVDIAIGITNPLPSNRSEFAFETLGKTHFVFTVSPKHPLAKVKEPIPTEVIKKYTAIIPRDSSRQIVLRKPMLLTEQNHITFSSLEINKQVLISGLGVGFLPYSHIEEDIKQGRLVIKKVEREQPSSYCYIGWNKTKTGKAQQWFIKQLLTKSIQKKLLNT